MVDYDEININGHIFPRHNIIWQHLRDRNTIYKTYDYYSLELLHDFPLTKIETVTRTSQATFTAECPASIQERP
jgi:hypothetical protein